MSHADHEVTREDYLAVLRDDFEMKEADLWLLRHA